MRARQAASAVLLTLLIVLAGCTAGLSPTDSTTEGASSDALDQGVSVTVIEVTDGDTMDVRFPDGREETVRLLGVDTPEVYAENTPDEWETIPDTSTGREWLKQWGENASAFAVSELDGETVELRTDPRADRRGGYGRLLVYLQTPDSDRSFNRQLLDRGLARLYDTEFSQRDAFATAEREAQESETGIWGFDTDSRTDLDRHARRVQLQRG